MEKTKITVETTVAAPVDKVWSYYTDPTHITQWNFANDDWQCPRATNDLRVGGIYSARMKAKDGSFGFDFEAVYDEVIVGKKLTYTMGDGRQATTAFEEQNGATNVSTTFETEGVHEAEMQRTGWQAILDNFKKYVEAH